MEGIYFYLNQYTYIYEIYIFKIHCQTYFTVAEKRHNAQRRAKFELEGYKKAIFSMSR